MGDGDWAARLKGSLAAAAPAAAPPAPEPPAPVPPQDPPAPDMPAPLPDLFEALSAPAASDLLAVLSAPPPAPPAQGAVLVAPALRAEAPPPAAPSSTMASLLAAESGDQGSELPTGLAQPEPPRPTRRVAPTQGDEGLAALEAICAKAPRAPGVITDWFGLRTPAAIAPELEAKVGQVLGRPGRGDIRARYQDWAGLAQSVMGAQGTWRGLAIGAGRGDLLLAGAVAARRRGLEIDLHATEGDAPRFAALLAHAEANGIDPTAHRFQQAVLGADPSAPPPRSVAVQEWMSHAETWDWVRVGPRGLLLRLLQLSAPLLRDRVRTLSLVTHSRGEEALAIRVLSRQGWRLVGEAPGVLRLRVPMSFAEPGIQVWRGPSA